jgi:hypothetical protein
LIGVISLQSEREIVAEFFQLFKTPWEFYSPGRRYDVAIITGEIPMELDAGLILFYSGRVVSFDSEEALKANASEANVVVQYQDAGLPIYGQAVVYEANGLEWLRVNASNASIAARVGNKSRQVVRCGYDLFAEIGLLLTKGQPGEYALAPSIDLHIAILRRFILNAGQHLIEIPPIPWGRDFIVCLTHDVDFYGIRQHFLDRTFFGFAYRALIGSVIDGLNGKTPFKKIVHNWFSFFTLPAVFLGLIRDFWIQFRRYIEIEAPFPSTFFFIPQKAYTGTLEISPAPKARAAKYAVGELSRHIKYLTDCGCEIGLHGIDSWIDPEQGRVEKSSVTGTTNQSEIGIRMHWLYFNDRTPQYLSQAGFLYDSSLGYNKTIGFKNGTVQIFAHFNTDGLMELPLNIMDTALFFPDRMNLTESEAWDKVHAVISAFLACGGVLTINWHHRSIAPERLWDDFYVRLLDSLKQRSAWFATGTQAVGWFKKRRLIEFGEISNVDGTVSVKLKHLCKFDGPGLMLRSHFLMGKGDCVEVPADGYADFEIPNENGCVNLQLN